MRAVRWWLWTVFGSILVMVAVGGITRLTGSGLSMVEWRPLMGALPPLDEAAWEGVFERYRSSPQYALVNHWMELEDFKRIFFWEYLHRLLGRLLGLLFVVPWVVFILRGRVRGRLLRDTTIALLLGGAQGLLGWIMVQSGLVDRPSVSHFRLAAHLALALLVAHWVLWLILDLRPVRGRRASASVGFRRAVVVTMGLLALQIVYGAFMAGMRAGRMSATFPDMNGHYGPGPFVPRLESLLYDPAAIHWAHRTLAWLVLLAFVGLAWRARQEPERVRRAAFVALAVATTQLLLGALTVLHHVPIALAVLHQCAAFLLLSATVWVAHRAGALPRRGGVEAAADAAPARAG